MDSPITQPESPFEITRRLENIVRKGTVEEVRLGTPARVRVTSGDNTTDWLPWIALRAGGTDGGRRWHPPVKGEQCVIFSPGGDMAQGVVMLGMYSDDMPQGSEQAECERTDWDEENFFEWLRGVLTVYCTEAMHLSVADQCLLDMDTESIRMATPNTSIHMSGSTVTIKAGGATLTIGPEQITSNVDIVAQGVSLVNHVHRGVRSGSDLSGVPQ